jgi:hypothetical protein
MDAEQMPRSRPGLCRLTLTINGRHYAVRPIASQADDVPRAFRLSRKGEVYDVAQTAHGPTCDCPDFIFRRDGLDPLGCLHIRAMRAVGML